MEAAKAYGLEERTFIFAKEVRAFVRGLPRTLVQPGRRQAVGPLLGFVGANLIEAAESLSAKDFTFRIRVSRKEAKESRYWLRLLHLQEEAQEARRQTLINEARELMLILNSVASKHRPPS